MPNLFKLIIEEKSVRSLKLTKDHSCNSANFLKGTERLFSLFFSNKYLIFFVFRRSGQSVNADEQLNLATTDMEESISAASSVANMRAFDMVRF